MKNFKTVLVAFCLLLAILLSAVACGESEEPTEAPTGEASQSESSSESESQTGASESQSDKESSKATQKPAQISYKDRSYPLQSITSKLKMIGRMQTLSNGLACDFTASGIAFNAYVEGEFSFTVDVTGQTTYFTVYVDGERMPTRYSATAGTDKVIEVGDLGDMALHEIRILKQNQPQRSLTVLKTIDFYGSIDSAAEDKELFIEIIGDSITCGHGNLCANGTASADTTLYEDGTQAYSFLTAQKLDADYSIIGCSGIGIDKGWTSFNEMAFYPKASYYRSNSAAYDFSSARVPDVIIINLGTNDNSRGSTETQFKTNLRELINFIRTSYDEDVPIVWAHNMMGECKFAWTQAVLAEFDNVYSVQLNQNGAGGQGHPTAEAHETAATTLANFILNEVEFN